MHLSLENPPTTNDVHSGLARNQNPSMVLMESLYLIKHGSMPSQIIEFLTDFGSIGVEGETTNKAYFGLGLRMPR